LLEASSEISSIFGGGGGGSSSSKDNAFGGFGGVSGGADSGSQAGMKTYSNHHQKQNSMSAPVPVRPRPPLAPGSRSNGVQTLQQQAAQHNHQGSGSVGDALRLGGGDKPA
jgi:hypothetical protein